ncbi:hypothetical protein BO86DRAFT_390680 [Aspergillus japonicus CBS 114.51]|uniref:Uncharacterized protein n=3 Tax=Aspergillus TaxID=5052 RepID=A0A2V5H0Y0_ASPV1|nr:hypothetical protein BO86DRAFT_390680 [Aspergillus japonicus CBS 114.51]PYI17191.1 hypothetical protein BO99DRAFT_404501 [Aspergillus violaceofuscus CBS 115571]RAH79908.1 hypothetical protein BO86DRAFT_390680 [Aspergillus japonicus CBS 114.51]
MSTRPDALVYHIQPRPPQPSNHPTILTRAHGLVAWMLPLPPVTAHRLTQPQYPGMQV